MMEKKLRFAGAEYRGEPHFEEEAEADLSALASRPKQTYLTLVPSGLRRSQQEPEHFYLPSHYYQPDYERLHQYEQYTYHPTDEEPQLGNADCPDCIHLQMQLEYREACIDVVHREKKLLGSAEHGACK
jgi:hypothetical protein